MLETKRYSRRPFFIDAIRVTEENISEVVKWCGGTIVKEVRGERTIRWIQVEVNGAQSERQKKALIGDWILKNRKSFKCYTNKAFEECFELPSGNQVPIQNHPELPFEGPIGDTQQGKELQERYAAGRV
jgi:hypothetical protein